MSGTVSELRELLAVETLAATPHHIDCNVSRTSQGVLARCTCKRNLRAMYAFADREGAAAQDRIEALEGALRAWPCGSCGGSGIYRQEWSVKHPNGFEGPCKVCEGTGTDRRARALLTPIGEVKP